MTHRVIPPTSRNKVVENWITPLELIELSAFRAWIRVFRRWVGSLCFLTNPQSIQEILSPLSMRAWVSTAFIVCEGVMSWTGICIVGDNFTNTFAQETEGRVCVGELFLSKNPKVGRKSFIPSPPLHRHLHISSSLGSSSLPTFCILGFPF